MIDDMLIVDATVHCYNWTLENQRVREAGIFQKAGYGIHTLLSHDDETRLSFDDYVTDWQTDELESILVNETPIDFACYHGTPIWDYFYDGHIAFEKGLPLRDRHPNRILLYGPVNPLETQKALEEMERMVEVDGIRGIKLYPAQYYRGRTIPHRLDDPLLGHPLIERAIELGIKSIAVHKAAPFGPMSANAFDVNDVDAVAGMYPEMNFEVVHSGFAFLQETMFMIERFPNFWANLEVTSSLVVTQPRRFAAALAQLLAAGGEDRIVLATGCTLVHARPTIEAFYNFEMPEDIREQYSSPPLTKEIKAKILGENFLRLHDVDPVKLREQIKGDAWDRQRPEELAPPWSTALAMRERVPA
ncbi:MAG TPA: amidohydrolase family protein [Nocardioides sp.]|uniref:amidohydrolase family protein n=1 Tax=uncultured Nocardioides sp. TaxID=198441 RepID=UPI00262513D1|nr:amidohydrolase family protein [uncultured Nocardioides sp.]HRI94025.1 amidohydrolase family protein [Nocardioides sp.]HRK44067.1 amidohydrolase family protein [Nocardioides sp.]